MIASASFDWEKSWPTISVSRALSAAINGALRVQRGGKSLLGTAAADLGLNGIDRLQAFDHLASERRLGRLVHLDEFASGMGETEGWIAPP
ncbi:hypothetical protein GCM10007857_88920 [Bradyrhizobium iriomotense]|uniref:IstB-like ATP-binding protein domain-containing protein n=1 Tax=Bradyrhizobium iriomotense TaxID=441950 RepID=A0ABQ6BCQ0_9BRAD|nr:hypothetical protein GCM10007857_88920 [Bradyrhizobium iriomotense]